ncbi:MAG: hypothetical protein U1F43_04050 [Myxococcota bacterium]
MRSAATRQASLLTKLGGFFAAGALVMGVMRASRDERPELVVTVARAAAPEAVQRAVDDALLVELGLGLGWKSDPVVVDRLVRGLRFVGASGDDPSLVARAEAMDRVRRDPLVRARLALRGADLLAAVGEPDDAALEAYRAAHAEAFRRPTTVTFSHALVDGPGGHEAAPDLVLGPHATRSETRWRARSDRRRRTPSSRRRPGRTRRGSRWWPTRRAASATA